jgi:hypothetical protein
MNLRVAGDTDQFSSTPLNKEVIGILRFVGNQDSVTSQVQEDGVRAANIEISDRSILLNLSLASHHSFIIISRRS